MLYQVPFQLAEGMALNPGSPPQPDNTPSTGSTGVRETLLFDSAQSNSSKTLGRLVLKYRKNGVSEPVLLQSQGFPALQTYKLGLKPPGFSPR